MTEYKPTNQSNSVIDVSHWNGKPEWTSVPGQNPGLRGVVAKATQGLNVDPAWSWNCTRIGPTGLLPGAYHFMTGQDDPVAQAEKFVEIVQPVAGILMAVDWEPNPGGPTATTAQVETMVQKIKDLIGRWPMLYLGRNQIAEPSKVLSNCDLWLPEYGSTPICPPGWTKWRLHQFTDGTINATGISPVIGVGKCDRSYYDESQGAIENWWGQPKTEGAIE